MTKLQVNTTSTFEIGEKVKVIALGHDLEGYKDEPALKVVKAEGDTNEYIALVPSRDIALEGDSPQEIVEKNKALAEKDGEIEGVIVKEMDSGSFYHAYLIEIKGTNTELKKTLSSMDDLETLDLTIKGSLLQHPSKVDVITDFEEGEAVTVKLELNSSGEPHVIYPKKAENHSGNTITAGEIKYTDDEHELLMKFLKVRSLEGVVFDASNSTYKIRVGIDPEEFEAIKTGKKVESVEDVMANIHATVGTPMETLESIHVYLTSQGINRRQVKKLMGMIRNYDDSVVDFIPQQPKTAYQDNKGLLKRSIAYLLGGESILMSGDAATGKNLMAETLCWAIQKPYRFYSINIQTDKFDLTGRTVLQSQSEGGGTKVQDSFLVQMMKHGGAILLDEMNASNPAIMTVLHSVAEKGHKMIDIESSDERVVAQNDFVLFGAMNPGYAGTGDLNEALHSRFATLNFGNNADILDLLKVHHESKEAPEAMLEQVNRIYTTLYENVKDGIINAKVLSFRRYASAVKYASEGIIPLKEAMIDNVANMVLDVEENEVICDAIDTHIA